MKSLLSPGDHNQTRLPSAVHDLAMRLGAFQAALNPQSRSLRAGE